MSSTHSDFLSVAETLMAGGSEGHWRSASSRAYYSVYHAALELADVLQLAKSTAKTGDHKKLQLRLESSENDDVAALGDLLMARKRERHFADYELATAFSEQRAKEQLVRSKYLIDQIALVMPKD